MSITEPFKMAPLRTVSTQPQILFQSNEKLVDSSYCYNLFNKTQITAIYFAVDNKDYGRKIR